MTITSSLNASSSPATSSSSTYESNLLYQSSQAPSNFDSLSSYQNRNQTALQRRALQLRRWREIEELEQKEKNSQVLKPRTATKVCFSPATLFLSACAQRDIDECERLLGLNELQLSGGVNVANCDGLTALHQACIDDNEPMVRWLLSKSANINCKDNEGWTPLHASASCGNYNIVKILVSHADCDVLALNCDNELACDVCETKECEDMIRSQMNKLLNGDDRGPNFSPLVEPEDESENEVFQELRQSEHKTIERDVSEWIAANGTIDIKTEIERTRDCLSGATILHVCAAKGYNEILHKLLNTFASQFDLDSFRDCDGYTALHAAAFWKQADTFETLLKYGANPELLTAKTSENIISSSVLELCKNDPKFVQLIEINKEKEKIAKESETQRKIFAKRQREIRRSTQGVKKEDLEKALKIMEISQSSTDSSEKDFNNILTKVNNMDSSVPSSTESEVPPVESESGETACWTITLPSKPVTSSPSVVESCPEKSVVLNSGDNSMAETPPTVTMKISSTTPAEYARRRRIKRRATGIEDDSGHVLSPDSIPDATHPLAAETVDAAFDVILPTPSNQSRSSRLVRPVSNSSSLSSLNSTRSNYDTDETTSIGSASVNSLDGVGLEVQKNQAKSPVVDSLFGSSKSVNTSLSGSTSESDLKETGVGAVSSEEIDYKKLCKQLLRENETLRRRIKELEESDKKREQEFSRERRSLQRTISEQEEELKSMNDIKADNMRLKDENAALIRVISKLSK